MARDRHAEANIDWSAIPRDRAKGIDRLRCLMYTLNKLNQLINGKEERVLASTGGLPSGIQVRCASNKEVLEFL